MTERSDAPPKRYYLAEGPEMIEDANGQWIPYADYKALLSEIAPAVPMPERLRIEKEATAAGYELGLEEAAVWYESTFSPDYGIADGIRALKKAAPVSAHGDLEAVTSPSTPAGAAPCVVVAPDALHIAKTVAGIHGATNIERALANELLRISERSKP